MLSKKSKIFIAGHKGMVGSSILRKLKKLGYTNILVIDKKKINLLDQKKVFNYLKKKKPSLVIIAAARVGGILANSKNKDSFLYENLQIQNNLIHGAYLAKIKNLIFLGSSCIYPKNCKQPMKEKYILSGKLEETNDAYAIAKIAGIYMCASYSKNYNLNYKSLMPPNMYGPGDNYNLQNSHFFSALIKKITQAKIKNKKYVVLWGRGNAQRELMFVEDFADALIFFMNKKIKEPFLNIGTGKSYSIKWYAKFLMKKIGVNLKIKFDSAKPDGMPIKCMDISLAKTYGWIPKNDFNKGFDITYKDFQENIKIR
tara:strand:+ start:3123 stop:4061 length:939 start_codon:yes stop_codon:yes gene_type:complete